MLSSRILPLVVLSLIVNLQSCIAQSVTDDSPKLSGNFSFLFFKPQTEADIWAALSKINNETRAILFYQSSPLVDHATASNSTQQMVTLLNNIFANNLTTIRGGSGALSDVGKAAEAPGDPTTITKILDPLRWREQFFNYQRGDMLAGVVQSQNLAILMKAQVTESMLQRGAGPRNVYPRDRFIFRSAPIGASWDATWSLVESTALLYQDLLFSFEMFGGWCTLWETAGQTMLPGSGFYLTKRTGPSNPWLQLARGSFEVQQRAWMGQPQEIPTS